MPSPQLEHPYTVVTVSCGRRKQEQVVQILARTGFWLGVRQSVKCLKCGQEIHGPPQSLGPWRVAGQSRQLKEPSSHVPPRNYWLDRPNLKKKVLQQPLV